MTYQQTPIDIKRQLYELERRSLDEGLPPAAMAMRAQVEHVPFVRVLGQSSFWKRDQGALYHQRMDDLITSAHGQGLNFYFLLIGQGSRIGLYVALHSDQMPPNRSESILRTILTSLYPGIHLKDTAEVSLGRYLEQSGFLASLGVMSGVPTRKSGESRPTKARRERTPGSLAGTAVEGAAPQIERLLRGLRGANWGYLVRAEPIGVPSVITEAAACFADITAIASQSKRQLQQVSQTMRQIDPATQYGETQSISGEMVDREAEYAVELLECQLERLDQAKAVGMWQTDVIFFAAEQGALQRTGALLRGVFAGSDSRPDPVRVASCSSGGRPASHFRTPLTSVEISTLAQMPREEFPGYHIADYATFDVDFAPTLVGPVVGLGTIDDGGVDTGLPYAIVREDFAKHGLVTGVTGSGKTTTIFAVLDALWNKGQAGAIPFLVLEPAKAEYRALRGRGPSGGQGSGPIPQLQVFTLGDETVAPFRLNPFEFEIADIDHFIHVQTHIDYLKSVFNAAFILYAPMPYVLETCLHEIYQDCGWDLTSSRNRRLPQSSWGNLADWPVFPTLADLYDKIDQVTDRLGYEERIKMDVQAGLKARIGSLMLGGKGLMLNTRHGIPIHDLLSRPTVLELERLGNDDEKAFLIGLIMTRLYEYRRVQAAHASVAAGFQHLVVVEEAHRLLQNVPTQVETEASNVKGQAVETFTNMLAEIRAYGQGMLIAEQIPSKLAPDAIKNTNLKIVHRLIAEDDRRTLAGATNMDEEQMRYLIALPPGRAAVYSEGADHPYLIRMQDYSSVRLAQRPHDRDIAAAMTHMTTKDFYSPTPDYRSHFAQGRPIHVRAQVDDLAMSALISAEFPEIWDGLLLHAVLNAHLAAPWFDRLTRLVARVISGTIASQRDVMIAFVLQAAQRTLQERGRVYGWSYDLVERLRERFVAGLVAIVQQQPSQARGLLEAFGGEYNQSANRPHGPFAGCDVCPARCLFRVEASHLVQTAGLRQEWRRASSSNDQPSMLDDLAAINRYAAEQVVGDVHPPTVAGLALCIAAQMTVRQGFSRSTQVFVTTEMARRLLAPVASR
jgi:hypothetical protein